MKFLIALTVVLAVASCSTQQKIEELKQSNWGKIFLNMAALQIKAGGPIEDLVKEIDNLRESDIAKLEKATEAFDKRTAEHEETVRDLNGKIADAQQGISNAQKLIAETLIPQKMMLEQTIADNTKQIQLNNEHIAEITAQRARDQADFEQKLVNANEASKAIDEALELLEDLSDNDASSFVQIKSAQRKLKKVTDKLSKSGENAWIKALVAIASNEYANSDAVGRVIQLLNDVKANIGDHITAETANNEKSIAAFEADRDARKKHNIDLTTEINECKEQLAQTIEAIQDTEDLIARLKVDLAEYKEQLEAENEAYEKATAAYEDLKAQLEKEIAACAAANEVLRKGAAGMADYIKGRVDDGITPLTEAHGEKINVHDYTYDK